MSADLAALRIGFIGAGRVAQTLAPAFDHAKLNVAAFYNRGADAAQRLGSRVPSARPMTYAQEVVDTCDLVFLAVSDDAIQPVCRGLRWEARHRVVHCSGATELTALDHAISAGALDICGRPDRRISSDADVCQSRRRARRAVRMHRRHRG